MAAARRSCRRTIGGPNWRCHFTLLPGTRQIFEVAIDQVQTSCGWGVPHMSFERERETLSKYHVNSSDEERFGKYARRTHSIDGLPVRNPTRAAQ